MYGYEWTKANGIFKLSVTGKIEKELRPVFKEELDYFGFDKYWTYPDTAAPLLWAEGIRRYILNGECVAELVGGGFYTKPTVNLKKDGITLYPIDIETLWQENEKIMRGLIKTAEDFIQKCYDTYSKNDMEFVVAFSGGKDSLALLDLVNDRLAPDKFCVVFNDTGMELSTTYKAVEEAKKKYPQLKFYTSKSHLTPEQSWAEFGPPGRRMRWCCAVHKSVPTILLMREITGRNDVKAVVFDGVRAEESAARASRDEISVGAKNINQINCSPIFKWNSAEIFIYLLHKNILFNRAYRYGLFRVGCKVCPLSSAWWDAVTNDIYHDEIAQLLPKVEEYAAHTKSSDEVRQFIENGGWKARMGGKGLPNGGNRVHEVIENDTIKFIFTEKRQDWLSVAPLMGSVISVKDGNGLQLICGKQFNFCVTKESVSYFPYSNMDSHIISVLRGVARKAAYCIGCKACTVQCPTGAFNIIDGKIFIRAEQCLHCFNCVTSLQRGCLVAKSLMTTEGENGMDLKGMNRYQHFGFRQAFLAHFFDKKEDCFSAGKLGTRQYDALKVWLKESGLLFPRGGKTGGSITPLCEKLLPLGPGNTLVWAVIWTNLSYNSVIVKWFMQNVAIGDGFDKNHLVFLLGDDYSKSTRENAVTALFETFRDSPIGVALGQGAATSNNSYCRVGWSTPDAVALLYALYTWAESTGRYAFTLTQMKQFRQNSEGAVDPATVFGIDDEKFKDILRELSIAFPDYIHTSFMADLDNVSLSQNVKSIDILDLVQGVKNGNL